MERAYLWWDTVGESTPSKANDLRSLRRNWSETAKYLDRLGLITAQSGTSLHALMSCQRRDVGLSTGFVHTMCRSKGINAPGMRMRSYLPRSLVPSVLSMSTVSRCAWGPDSNNAEFGTGMAKIR